ncbi:ATP-binding protein [Streptomyces meridianus]|uniref:ATP-binding protein n=1 Tax=Streptomyces meridianus TaxID=2938945 RepID=A0ABT0XAY6_9ACTN|nr:ATP-binding protein [Streptomyces meridianus]MCM2578897.1 ATP-binding protein [Streptomyces meridianus]
MSTEGMHDAPHHRPARQSPPVGPPAVQAPPVQAPPVQAPPLPDRPPVPSQGPGGGFAAWLRTPRPDAAPGIWRFGHRPRPPEEPDRTPGRSLLTGALVSVLCGWLLWSLLWNGYLGSYWLWPLFLLTPDSWRAAGGNHLAYVWATFLYYALVAGTLLVVFGRLGRWSEVWRRFVSPPLSRLWDAGPADAAAVQPETDPLGWPELCAAGAGEAAGRLAADARAGLMNDVDHARIERAWESVRSQPDRLPAFVDSVTRLGAAACAHPTGSRDLPRRAARHDLVCGQVRIGAAVENDRNPYRHRGAGLALDPGLLGTSLLAVGPPGSGKTRHLVRPVVESLCLQALAGRTAVVAVGGAGARLAPDDAFDVVVRVGRPDSDYDLDLYGGATDPDEAAAVLAEALVGDLAASLPGGDTRRAATALAQVLGPYRTAHGRFPAVPELRELLEGSAAAVDALRAVLAEDPRHQGAARELDARERQSSRPGDAGPLLVDRIALLDRPAFAGFFGGEGADGETDAGGSGTAGTYRPFSLRSLEHPLRVRIDLPERGHAEASRLLARLVLAQFTESAVARADRSLFACLVLDDASHVISPEAVRGLQRLRSAHAGALLTLRTLDDVPEPLRAPLLGAVGCRMAFSGITTWDGARFAEVWGKEWVEARDVTNRQIVADEPLTRVVHAVRRMITGRAVTAESVTVRRVERERWSASELAHSVPAGHAVLSVTTVRGEHAPPVLADLRG